MNSQYIQKDSRFAGGYMEQGAEGRAEIESTW